MEESNERDDAVRLPRNFWRQLLSVLVVIPAAVLVWAIVLGEIIFHSLHPWWYGIFWTVFSVALAVLVAALSHGRRWLVRTGAAVAGICVLLFVGMELRRYFVVTRFPQLCSEVYWHDYRPFIPGSRVVKVEPAPGFRIANDPPRISAAHMMYPLCAGVAQALYPPRDYDNGELTAHTPEHSYEMLLNGEADAIFAPPPTEAQLEAAKERGLAYQVTPLARDAFVFFVNKRNPVAGLNIDQLRGIYSGAITRWEDLGAGTGRIEPFQHTRGNSSQVMMERVMCGIPLMPPPEEARPSGNGGTVRDIADYRNYPGALGYSYRFFVNELSGGDSKLLSLDGVKPTPWNIRSGSYPIVIDCCVVTVRPRDKNLRKIVNFLRSAAGCELIEKTGYVPLSDPTPPPPVAR